MIRFSWKKNKNDDKNIKNTQSNLGGLSSSDAPPDNNQIPSNLKKLLSLREASELSGYHKDYLGQLIRGGNLHGIKKGRSWFTTQDALYNFLFERKPEHLVRLVQEGEFPDIGGTNEEEQETGEAPEVQDVQPPEAEEQEEETAEAEDIVPGDRPLQKISIRDSMRNFFTTGKVLAGSLGLLVLVLLLIGGLIWFFQGRGEDVETTQTQTGDVPVVDLGSALQITPSGDRARVERLIVNGTLQLDGPLVFQSSTQPDDPSTGQVYYDADTDQLFIFDGTEWVPFFTGDATDLIANFITPADLAAGLAGKVDLRPDLLTAPQAGDIDITGTVSAGDFTGTTFSGTTGTFSSLSLSTNLLLSGADTAGLAQLALIENADPDNLAPIALNITSEAGGIDIGIDLSDEDINTAFSIGDNAISASSTTIEASELILLSGRTGSLIDSDNIGDFALTAAAPGGGLEVIDDGTTLLASCTSGELLKWNGSEWECAIDTTGGGSNDSLQTAYGRGNTITTTDSRDILFTLADTATDSSFIVDMLGTGSAFEVRDAGSSVLTVADSGFTTFQNSADSTTAYQFLDADGGAPILNIDTENERVGVGTDSPNELLTLQGILSLFETTAPSTTANYGKLYVKSSDSNLYFLDDAGTETNLLAASALSGTGSDGQVTFWTGTNTLSGDAAFSWDNTTKFLGIGTTGAPQELLHLEGGDLRIDNGTNYANLTLAALSANRTVTIPDEDGTLCLQNSTDCGFISGTGDAFVEGGNAFGADAILGTTDSFDLAFSTDNTERVRIDTSGLFGIGTDSPNELLTVEGILSLFETNAPTSTSNYGKLYVKSSDSDLYFLDDSGTETNLLAAAGGNSVLLQSGSAQSAGNTTQLIWINETSVAAPNLIELEVGGSDSFVVSNSGSITEGTISWLSVTNQPDIVSSVEGVVNDEGDIDLVASGDNLTITGDDGANDITFDIDETVLAGEGIVANTTALDINPGSGIQIDTDAVALGPLTADWDQTGAFDIVLNNAGSELKILESVGDTFFGILDVTDLTADQTYTLPDDSGTVCLTSGNCTGGAGGGAPADAEYLVLSLNSDLTDERVLNAVAGGDIVLTDNGANGNLDISVSESPAFSTSVTTPLLTSNDSLTLNTQGETDDLVVETGGTERARVLGSGFFGVGNINPTSLFVAGTADCSGTDGSAWDCMEVDTTNNVGSNNDIAFDTIGTAWIAFQDSGNGDLLAAEYVGSGGNCSGEDGEQWNCYTVQTTSNVGHNISIAVDDAGNPWIAHRDFSTGDLLLARYVGSGGDCNDAAWDCDVVDSTNNVGWYTDIAFDSTDTAWISYLDLSNGDLRVAEYVGSGGDCTGTDGGEWDCSEVDSTGTVGFYTSIDFDSSDNPWISFQDDSNKDLKVARFVGGGSGDCTGAEGADWDCSVVDSTNDTGFETSIIVDSSDDAWISYRDGTDNNLRVARHVGSGGDCSGTDGGEWDCMTVESIDSGTTSIGIDSTDTVWTSFKDGGNLRSAKYLGTGGDCSGADGAAWDCSTIVSMGGDESSVAVDNADKPWISYRDVSDDGDLKLAKLGSFFRVNNFGNIIEATGLTSSGNIDISTGQILGGSPFIFEGATDDNVVLTMSIADPTAQRTITFPDATGTVVLNTTGAATTGVSAFVQGGNTWGEVASLGTKDAFDLAFSTANTERMRLYSSGKLSLGASSINTATTLFELVGTAGDNAAEAIVCIDDTGTGNDCSNIAAGGVGVRLSLVADGTISSNDFDVAETFPAKKDVQTAEIVSVSKGEHLTLSSGERHPVLERATRETSSSIIGAVSTNPGFLAGGGILDSEYSNSNAVPVALSGRVPVKVTNENGPIEVGDYITASSTPGAGMKATGAGRVLGIALEPLNCLVLKDTEGNVVGESACSGEVTVFVNPHYFIPSSEVAKYESSDIFSAETDASTDAMLAGLQDLFRVAGMHIKNGVVAFKELFIEKLTTRELVIEAEPPAFKESPVVGEGVLSAGESEVFIENDNVESSSRVLVTLTSLGENPITIAVTEKREGEGFMLRATSAPEEDITFDYWIVGVGQGESSENENDSSSAEESAEDDSENAEEDDENTEEASDSGEEDTETTEESEESTEEEGSEEDAETEEEGDSGAGTDETSETSEENSSGEPEEMEEKSEDSGEELSAESSEESTTEDSSQAGQPEDTEEEEAVQEEGAPEGEPGTSIE